MEDEKPNESPVEGLDAGATAKVGGGAEEVGFKRLEAVMVPKERPVAGIEVVAVGWTPIEELIYVTINFIF